MIKNCYLFLPANEDYRTLTQPFSLTINQTSDIPCVNIQTNLDDVVEHNEIFYVAVKSDDQAVVFDQKNASVLVIDQPEGM